MKAVESRAEVYLMAIQSLSRAEKEAVIARLLDDPQLREDILDLAVDRNPVPRREFPLHLMERVRVRQAEGELQEVLQLTINHNARAA